MKLSTSILCALPLCVGLHASTIATVSGIASYDSPGGYYIPCSQTSQADPATASCSFNSRQDWQAAYSITATASDGEASIRASGGAEAILALGGGDGTASFTDTYMFTQNAANPATQVQYAFRYFYFPEATGAWAMATLNGVDPGAPGTRSDPISQFLWYLTQPYDGSGSFQVTGTLKGGAGGENYETSEVDADLQIVGITMLDANGQIVAGTLTEQADPDPVPEPAYWPVTGLVGLALALVGKRRRLQTDTQPRSSPQHATASLYR